MERKSDNGRRVPIHTPAHKDQIKHYHPSPSLCRESCILSRYAHCSVTTIPGGRGNFPDLVGHTFLGIRTEFRIRRNPLPRTRVNKGEKKGQGFLTLALN
jgi:hypothetical protein